VETGHPRQPDLQTFRTAGADAQELGGGRGEAGMGGGELVGTRGQGGDYVYWIDDRTRSTRVVRFSRPSAR
jgi:hypothetical protein